MTYWLFYIVFGVFFSIGVIGYWTVTSLYRDLAATYVGWEAG